MRIIAGPWVGELGWEVMKWQGYVRKAVLEHLDETDEIIIGCRTGHDILYHDDRYAGKLRFRHFEPFPAPTCCELCGDRTYNEMMEAGTGDLRLPARRIMDAWDAEAKDFPKGTPIEPFESQEFVRLPKAAPNGLTVIHARSWTKMASEWRNVALAGWERLVDHLDGDCVSVGIPGQAYHISGTEDGMGMPLDETARLMSGADLIIGSDSGPMHVAALTETPRMVIAPPREHVRFSDKWLPFKGDQVTVVSTIDEALDHLKLTIATV